MKFVRPTPTHGWQSKCSVTQLENRWRQLIAALDWVDLLVFTGGIGEHDAKVRAAICGGLSWLGISLDTRNRSSEDPISNPTSRCSVRVLPSEEDAQIATHTWELSSGIS
jgi:acetate kinase